MVALLDSRPVPRVGPPRAVPFGGRIGLPLLPALVLSGLSGLALTLAFPSPNLWGLAVPAVAGALAALRGRGFWGGVLTGLVFGVTYWFTLIAFVTAYLGPAPLAALGGLEAALTALGGGLIALAWRSVPLVWAGGWGRLVLTPLAVALAWTARETIAGTWPYGGFAWGRVALSQSTGPFAPLAAWVGVTGLSFLLVWVAALAVACLAEPGAAPAHPLVERESTGRLILRRARALLDALPARLIAPVLVLAALLAVPAFQPTISGVLPVAGVQANSRSGYFQRAPVGSILAANVNATLPALGRGARLVIWPEGASDVSPLDDPEAAIQWNRIATLAGAPLLAGAITEREGRFYNSSLLWEPGAGVTQVYDKERPVPFGEYVPDRKFWTPFAPGLLGLIGRDYTPGTRSSVITAAGVSIGVDICFDIVDDGLILGSVRDGARLLVAQTNNADFGQTAESGQQLAVARMRAIETGRSIVTVSTVASTAAIGPDGRTIAALPSFRPGVLLATVPLAVGTTPAVAFGVQLGAALAALGVLVPLVSAALARPLRRRTRH